MARTNENRNQRSQQKRSGKTFKLISSDNLDALDDVMDEDMTFSDPLTEVEGLDDYKDLMRGRLSALPDTDAEFHEIVAEDDVVVVHFTYRGTHEGEYKGIEPTGNKVEGTAVMIDRLKDGKIVERTEEFDTLSWFQQLGVNPAEI
ncbi:ester cyclase [Natronococcus pandeyae]|nr:ester cyclase [Natronococcus pandeyae]